MRGGEAIRDRSAIDSGHHESFIAYSRHRYLKLAGLLGLVATLVYLTDRPYGSRYGGSWGGYTLGITAALLVVWLIWFGYRKRSYADPGGRLVGRLSAHVYFGVVLLVVATLHTGFHFGWNVHTLAYVLMCAAIFSGVFGVFCYLRYPRLMSVNRSGMTMQQMLGAIATIDDQLRMMALPLDEATAATVQRAVETSAIADSVWRQLTHRYPDCTTAAAVAHLDSTANSVAQSLEESWTQVRVLLDEKASLLNRVRRDISYKTILEIWLYMHVPLSFMLLAALVAHIISILMFW